MEIDLNPRFESLWECKDYYMILYGSRSSSKSDFVATKLIANMMLLPYCFIVSIRNKYVDIAETSFKTMKEKIEALGVEKDFTITVSPFKIVYKPNGNSVIFRGLDRPESLKSLKDPSILFFEEDFPDSFSDYMTICASLRSNKAPYLQVIHAFNPVMDNYEEHWFYKMFFEGHNELSFRSEKSVEVEGRKITRYATIHHSTWRDNIYLPKDQALTFEAMKIDPVKYQQESLGLFCNRIAGTLFYKHFKMSENVKEFQYDPNLALFLTFDFNSNPYGACLAFQGIGKELYQVKEFCLRSPLNTTKDVARAIAKEFSQHRGAMILTGDPNGYRRDTRMERDINDYTIIMKELARFHPTLVAEHSYESVSGRGLFINAMLLGEIPDCKVWINPNAKETILDFLNVKEDKDRTKLKEKFKDKNTGDTYERYGHCFTGNTLITTINGDVPIKDINVGDLVLTRNGYKRVLNKFNNGLKAVKEYVIGENKLVCTPDHKIWTEEVGFVEIDTLLYRNSGQEYTIMDKQLCKKKLSIMEVINGAGIQATSCLHSEIISLRRLRSPREIGKMNAYIDGYGLMKLEQFQMDIISTTWMEILLITSFLIWNVFQLENILNYMDQKVKNVKNFFGSFNQKLVNLLKNGISQKKVENGIKNTYVTNYKQLQILENVLNVGKNMKEILYPRIKTTAPNYVQLELIKEEIDYGKDLQMVYDLEVEECHEYFANDILVHNCSDAFDYLITHFFKSEYYKYKSGGVKKYVTSFVKGNTRNRAQNY